MFSVRRVSQMQRKTEAQITASGYSVFEYLYRDASNYKTYGQVRLEGHYSEASLATIRRHVGPDSQFVPQLIGLLPFQERPRPSGLIPTKDDHVWHEVIELRQATEPEIATLPCWGTLRALLAGFDTLAQISAYGMELRVASISAIGEWDSTRWGAIN